MVKQYGDLNLEIRRGLQAAEDPQSAGRMARQLLCRFSGKSQEEILACRELYAPEEVVQQAQQALDRLLTGEPLAYVLGEWEFYGLPMHVTRDVLIPRDDTCAVAALAIKQALFLSQDPRILDLCCGSGCIGLAIASRVRDARVTLADLSREALAVAKENTALNKLSGRVRCVQADALGRPAPFLGKFDMIVSNPPYVTQAEMEQLPPSVRDFEPAMALLGGADGLDFYRALIPNYAGALKSGGYLCLEFGMGQGDQVCGILAENGYTVLERTRDYNDRERAVLARYGGMEEPNGDEENSL